VASSLIAVTVRERGLLATRRRCLLLPAPPTHGTSPLQHYLWVSHDDRRRPRSDNGDGGVIETSTQAGTVVSAQRAGGSPGPARSRVGKMLSLLIPMHNEEPVLDALFERSATALEPLGLDWEVVCVEDGRRDGTLASLRARALADARIKIVALSRNFGKDAALTAALDAAEGDLIVPIDADLQDP